jgi:2Fe-2S ferredoxin
MFIKKGASQVPFLFCYKLFPCRFARPKTTKKRMYTLHFTFEEKDLEPITIENCPADDSILEVALKNNIRIHHNCGGVCACSTCHVYVDAKEDSIEELSDREEDFIDRARSPRLNSRLSCQCLLLNGSGEIFITVPDQRQIHGE